MNANQVSPDVTCRVLLVDDNADVAEVVKAHLEDPRIRLTVASSGMEGLEVFRDVSFDVILMDLQMPEMNGYETTKAIRSWERRNHRKPTPIAALTGASSCAAVEEAYDAGCTQYLPKPITRNMLLQTVSQYFTAARAAQSVMAELKGWSLNGMLNSA